MATKFKLPDFNTVQTEYKPRFKATYQTGLFQNSKENPFKMQEVKSPSLFAPAKAPEVIEDEDAVRITALEKQVANLTTRLEEAEGEKGDGRSAVEKMLNLPAGQVWWMDAFDIIDRPLRAVKEGLTDKSFKSAWEAFTGNRPGPFQEGYIEGSQFLVNMGIIPQAELDVMDPTQKLLYDIGIDILADPLTYTGPIKILQSLGILSKKKVVTTLDEALKAARKAGLINATEEVVEKALKEGAESVLDALRKIYTGADGTLVDITEDALQKLAKDIVADPGNIRKVFKQPRYTRKVKAVAKQYSDDLIKAGIRNPDEFVKFMNKLGQAFDPKTGKIIFIGKRKVAVDILKETSEIRKFIKPANNTVEAIYNAAKAKKKAIEDALILAFNNGTTLADEAAQKAILKKLTTYVDNVDDILKRAARDGIRTGGKNPVEITLKNLLKPGEGAELTASMLARDLMEKKAKAVFGDNIIVLAGDSKAGGTDLAFFYRLEDGTVAQLKTKKGLPFMFEIKDPARFSLENLSMTGVNKTTIKAQRKAREAARAKLKGLEKGTDAYREAFEEYKKASQKYLFELKMFRQADGNPTFRLVDTDRLVEQYGYKALEAMNESLRKLFNLRKTMGEKWNLNTYFSLLRKYDNQAQAAIKSARETAEAAGKELTTQAVEKITKKIRDEVFGNSPYAATLTLKGGQAETIVRELLKVGEAANPKGAYGFVIQNAKGVEELVILNADDFFKNINFVEFSFQATQRKGGTSQKVVHHYFNVDIEKLDSVTKNNSWFMKELGIAAPSIKQTVEYTPGLIVRMLNGLTKTKIPFVAPTAEFIAKAVDGFTFLFNAKAGMSDELAEFLSKIPAEDIQAAKISVGRVKEIVDDVVRQTKGRYTKEFVEDVVQELIEQGWDGISVAGRKMKVKEIFKRWVQEYSKAGTAMFARLDDIQFRNFSSAIEDILKRNGLDPNLVKLTQREKFTLVEFADNLDKKALEEIADGLGLIGEEVLDIGKAPLTAQELAFAKEFNGPIQEIIEETINQQTILRELGFEFSRDMLGTGAYFRHAINPRMLAFLKKNSKAGTIKQFLDAGTDLLKDRLYIGSTREINAAVREMFGISIDLFSTDVYYNFADLVRVATTKNEMSQVLGAIMKEQDTLGRNLFEVLTDAEIRARGLNRHFNVLGGTFRQEFPNLFKNVSPQTQEMLLKYFADKGLGEAGSKITIQKAAYGVLKRLDNAYVDLPAFVKSFDQYMKFWKTFALITPGYHMRNFFGNITNSYMVGMSLPNQSLYLFQSSWDFTRYKRVLKALQNGEDLKRFNQGTIDSFLRVDEYYRSGAAQSHRGVRDLEVIKEGLRQMRGQRRNVAQKVGDTLLNLNYTFAENADDLQRYALYRWAYKNADSSAAFRSAKKAGATKNHLDILRKREAYKKVSEALFDYSHLTAFEKEYMKRLFPFYTFFKNNLILQAKTIFNRPGQYAKLFRGYRYYTESMTGFDIEDLPNYMTDNLWLPMPYRVDKTNKEAIAWLRANLPPSDFTEFVENPFQRGVVSLTAPIKMFIELGTGRDLFTGRQIQEFPGELSQYEGEGVLQKFRDERGRLTLSQNPYAIKFLNDIGFRSILSYGSAGVDIVDYMGGTLTTKEMGARLLDALGITRVQELDKMEIAALYQNLDKLRDAKSLYDQENEGKLPTLAEIQAIAEQQEQQRGNPFANLFN